MQREFTHYAMAKQLREDFSFAKVAIKPYAEGVYSLCYGRATKGKHSFAKVRLSHTQREFIHYVMAEQLREDFSFANVAIKLGCPACLSCAEREQTGKTFMS